MSFLFLSGSPAKGSSNTGPDFKACRRAALIRRNSFFIRLEFYGIRGLRRERKKEARRIPVHYKDSVFSGINKVFGANSTECGKNRTFRRIGRTERREGNRRRSGCRCGPYRTRPLHEVIQYLFFLLFSMIVSKFSLPHSFSRIKWGIRVAPNSDTQYSVLGGTVGYIFRVTKPSVTSERKTAESIFSDMEGMVLYSSLKRKTPFACNSSKTAKAHLSPSHSNTGAAAQYS